MSDMIHYKIFPSTHFKEITKFREAFQEYPSWNKYIQSQPPLCFFNMDFRITLKSVRGNMVSTITRIYDGKSGVQILDGARELSFLQNIQASCCA